MKIITLAVFVLISADTLFSQNQPKIEDKITPITIGKEQKSRTSTTLNSTTQGKPVTISKKAGEPQRVHDANYYQEEINKIDAHIQAINTKISIVQNDPTENQLAIQNGWYNQMSEIKDKLNAQKAIYQQKLNELN